MPYINKTVSAITNECEFIKEFVRQLTQADSRITCNKTDTDFDTMFSNGKIRQVLL